MFIFLSITCFVSSGQVIDYGIDAGFNTGDFYNRGSISAFLLNEDSSVLITGHFGHALTEAGGISIMNYNGSILYNSPVNNLGPSKTFHYLSKYLGCGLTIQRFNEFGTDYSFQFEYMKSAYNGFLTNRALGASIYSDSLLLVTGRFFTDSLNTNDPATIRQLCMVDSTGKPDPGFPMLHCAEPFNAEVYSVDTLSDGSYILAGRFEECNGHTYHNVIKLNPDFSVDNTFVNSLVYRSQARILLVDSLDRIWLSTSFGGLLSSPQDTLSVVRLMPNGEVDNSFIIPELIRELPDTDPPAILHGFISRIIQDDDGTFICTGPFTAYNGVPKKKITKIYDNGALVAGVFDNWGPDEAVWGSWVSEYGGGIGKILKLPDGKILLGGTFSSFGGEPYNCMVRLMPTGYVGVEEPDAEHDIQVYPNPTTGQVRLGGEFIHQFESVVLYDMSGQVVWSQSSVLFDGTIDISAVPAGVYLIAVNTATERVTRKVVKY